VYCVVVAACRSFLFAADRTYVFHSTRSLFDIVLIVLLMILKILKQFVVSLFDMSLRTYVVISRPYYLYL